MKFKTPDFWYRDKEDKPGHLERFITPLSWLYSLGYAFHQGTTQSEKAEIPILCIGNLNAGGTGKTPTALALMQILKTRKIANNPFFLSRGYGGGEHGPLKVNPEIHDAWSTGDEALMLSIEAPTIVSADRLKGAEMAVRNRADLLVMDDGLQNPGIHKDLKFIVINGEMGFGNGKVLPAGPLRAPLHDGLEKADAFIMIGADKRNSGALLPAGKPVFHARLEADHKRFPPKDKSYLAFAGLGYPDKFFNFLRDELQLKIADTVKFPDHYPYSEYDLKDLSHRARNAGLELLTTQKDFMRLPKIEGIEPHVLHIHLSFDQEEALADFLQTRLPRTHA